jgi:predicted PurR-regulated permease PerM
MRPVISQPFKARTTEELMALLSAVATAILAVIIIAMLYFGREIFVPIGLAILLSFVLAPLVAILQRIHVLRGFAVVSVVILAFALIFAMGSLLATQLTRISPLIHPLATTGIIIIFVIFILLQREDLRNRIIRLAGSHDLQRTAAALDDAARRLSRLFLTLSLSETQSCWQLISNRAMLLPYARGL